MFLGEAILSVQLTTMLFWLEHPEAHEWMVESGLAPSSWFEDEDSLRRLLEDKKDGW